MSAYTIGALVCGVLAVPSVAYIVALFVHFHRQGRPTPAKRPQRDPRTLCMRLGCTNEGTTTVHGWLSCDEHKPAKVAS